MLHPIGREYLHGEHATGDMSNHFIVTRTDKYVWFSQTGREQYFDLANDPMETHDGVNDPENAQRISEMRALLIKELTGREEGYVADGKLVVGCKPQTVLMNPKK